MHRLFWLGWTLLTMTVPVAAADQIAPRGAMIFARVSVGVLNELEDPPAPHGVDAGIVVLPIHYDTMQKCFENLSDNWLGYEQTIIKYAFRDSVSEPPNIFFSPKFQDAMERMSSNFPDDILGNIRVGTITMGCLNLNWTLYPTTAEEEAREDSLGWLKATRENAERPKRKSPSE